MESKKIQGKYEIPSTRVFKVKEHDQLVKEQLTLMSEIRFFEAICHLNCNQVNYIDFYNIYIPAFALEHYKNEIDRMRFMDCIRDMNMFDHLHLLKEIIRFDSDRIGRLKKFVKELLDEVYVTKEKDRVLSDNFINVIEDIDQLVREEYYRTTGKYPEFTIFDSRKIAGEIESSMEEKGSTIDQETYNALSTEQVFSRYTDGKDDMETNETRNQVNKDLFQYGGAYDERNKHSSYPVDMEE
jgi:hypothetical protein